MTIALPPGALLCCALALAGPTPGQNAGQNASRTTASSPRDREAGHQEHSRTPPKGAPWTTDFFAAHRRALAEDKPIFVYSTKTY